jgi:hypothetical protein
MFPGRWSAGANSVIFVGRGLSHDTGFEKSERLQPLKSGWNRYQTVRPATS